MIITQQRVPSLVSVSTSQHQMSQHTCFEVYMTQYKGSRMPGTNCTPSGKEGTP